MSNNLPKSQLSLVALIRNREWDCVAERLKTERGKKASQREDRLGLFPIHHACDMGAPLKVIDALLEAYPQGIQQKSGWCRHLSIYLAAFRRCSGDVFQQLSDVYHEGLQQKSKYGGLPIHHAARTYYYTSLDVIKRLIEAYPGSLQQKDDAGRLPIHHAALTVKTHAFTDVVMYLTEAYPDGLQHRDRNGMLPIHLAVLRGFPSMENIQILLESYPMSIILSCPYHVAVENKGKGGGTEEVAVLDEPEGNRIMTVGMTKTKTKHLMPSALLCYDRVYRYLPRLERLAEITSYLENKEQAYILELAHSALEQNDIEEIQVTKKQKLEVLKIMKCFFMKLSKQFSNISCQHKL